MSHEQHQFPVPPREPFWSPVWQKFKEKFPEQVATKIGTALLALVGLGAVWLWGWIVGGGLTRFVGAVPPGAVVAFATPCPLSGGWSEFGQAAGRFVIGANIDQRNGLKNRRPADPPGGSETVTLTTSNIPPHKHHGKTVATTGKGSTFDANFGGSAQAGSRPAYVAYDLPQKNDVQSHEHTFETDDGVGLKGGSFEIMPPYVALYYCKKD